jgi:hypothetical protein
LKLNATDFWGFLASINGLLGQTPIKIYYGYQRCDFNRSVADGQTLTINYRLQAYGMRCPVIANMLILTGNLTALAAIAMGKHQP